MKRRAFALGTIVAVGLLIAAPAWTGDSKEPPADKATGHVESPRDAHLPTPRQVGAGYRAVVSRDGHVSVQVNVDELGNNIVGDAANEPSIAIDPTEPTRMVIGWRQFDNIASDFRQAGYGYTSDGGHTWTFPGVIEPGIFRSDPVLDSDADGNFFYNSLTADSGPTNFRCHVFKSVDGGATWDAGVYAEGGDKQWQVIDTTNGVGRNNIYASWNSFYSACSGNFTRSYDGGQTFLPCTTVAGDPHWGVLAVGPDGELYVSGTGMTFAKSSTMQDETLPAAWDFSLTVDLDGSLEFSAGPNPAGLLGQNWIAVDRSDGPTRGNIYMLASVDRSSTTDPLDVMFARSTDGGQTWSPPVRVNDDPGETAYQWFGTMSVAPNGRIDAVWLDTRNDPGGYDSELYYSFSTDAGVTWSPNEVLTPPFDPHLGWPQQNKMGDYFDMISDEWGASLAYAATFNGEQDVYFIRIGDPICPDDGRVTLDRASYACEDTVGISVLDCGLNTDDNIVETVVVTVDSDSEPAGESVTLTETHAASARFEGTIDVSVIDGPGVLRVAEGDTVTATYNDADDGQGGINIPVTAGGTVDCTPPVIANVQSSNVTGSAATITWNTHEPADSVVTYGLTPPGSEIAGHPALVTDHLVQLTGLQECSEHVFSVASADAVGNGAADDNAGSYYTFETRRNSEPDYPSTDTPIPIADNTTHTSTVSVADDVPVTGIRVEINITHTYTGDLDITLINPVGTRVLLVADRGGTGNNFSGTVFDDEAATPISSGSAPFTGSFQPEEPLASATGGSSLGDWVLEVVDDAGGDTGSLDSWTLTLINPTGSCGPSSKYHSHALDADSCPAGAGNANGFWDTGETVEFSLSVINDGTDPLTGVRARVIPATAGVIMIDAVADLGDVGVAASATSAAAAYSAQLPSTLTCGATLDFQVVIEANEGRWWGEFTQAVGQVIPGGPAVAWSEDFDAAAAIPAGWTIKDGLEDGHTWYADDATDPAGCNNTDPAPPVGGTWAAVDSDCAGSGVAMDEELITPAIDLTGITQVTLEFDHYFNWLAPETADVDVRSTLTGGAWVNVARWTDDTGNPEHAAIDITAHAAGVSDLQIRWHYYNAEYEWFWYIDNIALTYPTEAGCEMPVCLADPPGPPPIPDGSSGTQPLLMSRLDPAGTQIELDWDDQCLPVGTKVVYGPLSQASTYAISGAVCGASDPHVWDPVPAGDLWLLLVSDDGAGVESSWGLAQGAERNGLDHSDTCGSGAKAITGTCP
jgi:subtilisin-like proprotein convertase family protein